MLPMDMFIVILFFFEFEDVVNEELVEILIGVVDAQLLEVLKPKMSKILRHN